MLDKICLTLYLFLGVCGQNPFDFSQSAWAGCDLPTGPGIDYKWALFVASTKNYEYYEMFASYQQCQDAGKEYAAHYDGNGNPLYQCRLAIRDH